jgi:hypothetical protein
LWEGALDLSTEVVGGAEPLSARSVHAFSDRDPVLPYELSVHAAGLYRNPRILLHSSAGHNPPYDEETSQRLAEVLHRAWRMEQGKKQPLELEA